MGVKIAIVDDDAGTRAGLRALLTSETGDAAVIEEFPGGEEFLSVWSPGACDLILLDIFMGGLTGMDVARKVRETDPAVCIVFGSTSNDFASESYEVNACYYLHKPFRPEGVRAMLDRLSLLGEEKPRTVILPGGVTVPLAEIVYADFARHKVTVHCRSGKTIPVRASFSEVEPLLCAHPEFFSPCKGITVNFGEVAAMENNVFLLSDGTRVPISRRRAKDVREAYSTFRFDRMRKDGDL